MRVPESLLFPAVCSNPWVPSALCCDGDTALGRGDVLGHGWHRDCHSVPRSKGTEGAFSAILLLRQMFSIFCLCSDFSSLGIL